MKEVDVYGLRPKESEIYHFIIRFATENGFLPTDREIGDAVGLKSTSSVFMHFENLRKKGYIGQVDGRKRYYVKGLKYVTEEIPEEST